MEMTILTNSYGQQLVYFVLWSGLLCAVAGLIAKFLPHLTNWSRFWQTWSAIALIPLLPTAWFHRESFIPEILVNAFDTQTDSFIGQSKIVLNKVNTSLFDHEINMLINGIIIIGVIYGIVGFVISLFKLNQLIKLSKPLCNDEPIFPTVESSKVHVRVIEGRISPFVYGFFNSVIVVPKQILSMPLQQQKLLIEHELTHIKKGDPKSVMIMRFITCVCWFNPFMLIFEKRFLQAMELNCDQSVLANNPSQQRNYAHALLTCLKLTNGNQNNGLTAYFSGARFSKKDFEQRIRNSMSNGVMHCYGLSNQLILVGLILVLSTSALVAKPLILSEHELMLKQGIVPVEQARISSTYDEVNKFRSKKPHKGIDFAAPAGTDVIASFSGVVLIADDSSLHRNYGNVILIENKDNVQSLYAHLDSFLVEPGQRIIAGQKIGTVGTTGRVTGPHLHFEMLKDKQRINPKHHLNMH